MTNQKEVYVTKIIETPPTIDIEDLFKTTVHQITITLHNNKHPHSSDKALVNAITQWIQYQLEQTRNKITETHGEDASFTFSISHHETDRINLGA